MHAYNTRTLCHIIEVIEMLQNQVSLKEYKNRLDEALNKSTFDPKLRQILEDSKQWACTIKQIRTHYKEFANNYFNEHKPFQKTESFGDHLEIYLDLLSHCIYAGDETLLSQWGVTYPYENKCPQFDSPRKYLEAFKLWRDAPDILTKRNINPDDVNPYLDYLIHQFEHI